MDSKIYLMTKLFYIIFLLGTLLSCQTKDISLYPVVSSTVPTVVYVSEQCDSLIHWAISDVAQSIQGVTGNLLTIKTISKLSEMNTDHYSVIIGQYADPIMDEAKIIDNKAWDGAWEQFLIKKKGRSLFIVGSDVRGTVYGIFELAERLGISPWVWWADVKPLPQKTLKFNLPAEGIMQSPSVKFRGVFLNDEDWGLQPWAAKTFEPETGDIGPKTYEKIFQLMLRLKANTIWPAMHDCTKPFFNIEGNKEMAQKYHIVLGSSHAEPMLRNNVREWDSKKNGRFNYFNNSEKVLQYWQERVVETKNAGNECMYSMGMRGIHDSKMEGASNLTEMVQIMDTIISDQRQMLTSTLAKPIDEIPQVLVPYKEVLDIYNAGLKVPEDITLMWCDDNYGYIRRMSNAEEQNRKGGAGVYYHISYWGRPHDYLWLSTTQPGLIWYEMTKAYQNGADKIWIVNVGDIKPAEYNVEFFLDLAWDTDMVDSYDVKDYLLQYYSRDFGEKNAASIAEIMDEYYRLAFLRKPEYMGWSQTEPTTQTGISDFSQYSNGNEVQRRIDSYDELVMKVDELKKSVNQEQQDAFFQLIEYPVKGAANMNYKFMYAQLAHNEKNEEARVAYLKKMDEADTDISDLTEKFNTTISGGKWQYMMDSKPRRLPVFKMPEYHLKHAGDMAVKKMEEQGKPIFIQAKDFDQSKGVDIYKWEVIKGLGYSDAAISLYPFNHAYFEIEKPSVYYSFDLPKTGQYEIEIRCLPTHANNMDHELSVSIDDGESKSYGLNTTGRSAAWKENVLRNFKSVKHMVSFDRAGEHTLSLSVNQTGIVIDQIAINPVGYEPYYEIQNGIAR